MTRRSTVKLFIDPELPGNLLSRILARIAIARRRAARLRLAALGLGLFVSGAALVSSSSYAVHEFASSGFSDYLSLAFSDTSIATAYWQELVISLAESLPSLAILLLFGFAIVFLWSLRGAIYNARIILGGTTPRTI